MHQHRIEQIHQRDKDHEFDQQDEVIKIGKALIAFVNTKDDKQAMDDQAKRAESQDKAQPSTDAKKTAPSATVRLATVFLLFCGSGWRASCHLKAHAPDLQFPRRCLLAKIPACLISGSRARSPMALGMKLQVTIAIPEHTDKHKEERRPKTREMRTLPFLF